MGKLEVDIMSAHVPFQLEPNYVEVEDGPFKFIEGYEPLLSQLKASHTASEDPRAKGSNSVFDSTVTALLTNGQGSSPSFECHVRILGLNGKSHCQVLMEDSCGWLVVCEKYNHKERKGKVTIWKPNPLLDVVREIPKATPIPDRPLFITLDKDVQFVSLEAVLQYLGYRITYMQTLKTASVTTSGPTLHSPGGFAYFQCREGEVPQSKWVHEDELYLKKGTPIFVQKL